MKRNALLEFAEMTVATSATTTSAWMYTGTSLIGPQEAIPEFQALVSTASTGSTAGTITIALEWGDGASTVAKTQTIVTAEALTSATHVAGHQICAVPISNFAAPYVRVAVTPSTGFTTVGKMKFAFVPHAPTAGVI